VQSHSAVVGGIPGFVVNAPATNGDSGGPVLDNQNRVLGVVLRAREDGSSAYAVHAFYVAKLLGEAGP